MSPCFVEETDGLHHCEAYRVNTSTTEFGTRERRITPNHSASDQLARTLVLQGVIKLRGVP